MSQSKDRLGVLKAVKKCLSDAYDYFQEAMDILDDIGRDNIGPAVTPLVGGHAMQSPKKL